MSYFFILPAHTEEVLHLGSAALGFTMAGFGFGAALGALTSSRLHEKYMRIVPILATAGLGLGMILFANTTTLFWSVLLVIPTGFAYLMLACTNQSHIQLMSDDEMRGRVMSFYAMGALGGQPLGSLLLGYLADHFGVPAAFMLGGAACIISAIICLWSLRRLGLLKV
jgi:predicted MFS family arabinose efflux permease